MAQPSQIRRLDPSVVNKIAAGEVIQRPASALKELLENSLDAGATQISIVVKDGGNKLLQISDTGHGIRKEDLPVLCHRHTTSKLASFEDLQTINTLGFRGEALCSISFVSNLSVTTMTEGSLHGYRVTYKDSEMQPPGPKPVAAVRGTTISVEDLFYNVPTRRKALKSAAEEYTRVMDIVTRYALLASGRCAFSCKRQGEARADLLTLPGASVLDNIRSLYGAAVANNLLPISLKVGKDPTPAVTIDEGVCMTLEGYISSASYAAKRTQLVLFINGRAVECGPLRRALEATYAQLLPKASKPFLFLHLHLPPRHVDVNTHPTKREVAFMHQDEITTLICEAVESTLSTSNTSRTLSTLKSTLTSSGGAGMAGLIPRPSQTQMTLDGTASQQPPKEGHSEKPSVAARPDRLVRVDHMTQSLDAFFPGIKSQKSQGGAPDGSQASQPAPGAAGAALTGSLARKRRRSNKPDSEAAGADPMFQGPDGLQTNAEGALVCVHPDSDGVQGTQEGLAVGGGEGEDGNGGGAAAAAPSGRRVSVGAPAKLSECLHSCLDSIQGLAAEVDADAHAALADLLRGHVFVGMADHTRALLQFRTKLYIVDLGPLSRELFYQQVLAQFEAVESVLVLDPPLDVRELMAMALAIEQARGAWEPEVHDGVSSEQELCELVAQMLAEKAPMLEEYLGMRVDEKGFLHSVPLLLHGWQPDLGGLCDLVLVLARDVAWDEEQPCFRTLAHALSDFLALKPPLAPSDDTADDGSLPPSQATQGPASQPLPAHAAGAAKQMDMDAGEPGADGPPNIVLTPPSNGPPTASQPPDVQMGEEGPPGCTQDAEGAGQAGTQHTGGREAGLDGQGQGDAPMDWQGEEHDSQGREGEAGQQQQQPGTHDQGPSLGPSGPSQGAGDPPQQPPPSAHQSTQNDPNGGEDVAMLDGSTGGAVGGGGGEGVPLSTGEAAMGEGPSGNLSGSLGGQSGGSMGSRGGGSGSGPSSGAGSGSEGAAAREWRIKHVLMPAMRSGLWPSRKRAADGTCVEIAALERMYKIFERC